MTSSCEYNPTGESYTEIVAKQPRATIDLNLNGDTIKVWGTVNLRFSIDVEGRSSPVVGFFLDDSLITSYAMLQGDISFNSEVFRNGTRVFKVVVISGSGTGSIADRLGTEKAVFTKEWVMIIDNYNPEPVSIISMEPFEGQLKIEWNKYNHLNFSFYTLYINDIYYKMINDVNTNYFIDTNFVAGKVSYRVDISAGSYAKEGITKTYEYTPKVKCELIPDSNKVKISWSKSKFYKNFYSYIVFRVPQQGEWRYIDPEVIDINDTVRSDNAPPFGQPFYYKVGVYNKYSGIMNGNEGTSSEIITGKKFPVSGQTYYSLEQNSYYVSNNNGVYKIDANTYEITSSQTSIENAVIGVSPNGKHIYLSSGSKLFRLNSSNLAVEKVVPLTSIAGYSSYRPSGFKVTDDMLLAFSSFTSEGSNNYRLVECLVIDLKTDKVFARLSRTEAGLDCNISNNGIYCYTGGSFYNISNGNFEMIGSEDNVNFIGDGEYYLRYNSLFVYLKKSSNLRQVSVLQSADLNQYFIPYDYKTGYIALYHSGEGNMTIYDPLTFREIESVSANENCLFINSTLFSSNGYYLPVNLD